MLFRPSGPSVSGTGPYFACSLNSAHPSASGRHCLTFGASLASLSSCLSYVLHTWDKFLSTTAANYLSIYLLDQAVSFLRVKRICPLSLFSNKVTSIEQELHNYCPIIKGIFKAPKNWNRKRTGLTMEKQTWGGWQYEKKKEGNWNYEESKKKNAKEVRCNHIIVILLWCRFLKSKTCPK